MASACGETIAFCVSSLGRNCYLQVPTGLFGGDITWGIGAYDPVTEVYRNSTAYRNTVTVMDAMYQRAPIACWYSMGRGIVRSLLRDAGTSEYVMELAWTITDGLWNTVRVPGQCLTFADGGTLIHAALSSDTTQALAVARWPAAPTALGTGDLVSFMLRQRPPRATILGPIEIGDDGWSVQIQGSLQNPEFVPPEPGVHLLYLGRRGTHPTLPGAVDTDAARARDWIFAVDSVDVRPATADAFALRSTPLPSATFAWTQLNNWLAVGSLSLSASAIPTGARYDWPYPPDQAGNVWVAVPRDRLRCAAPGAQPQNVYFVRDAVRTADLAKVPALGYANGDNLVVLDDTTGLPTRRLRYSTDTTPPSVVEQDPLPDSLLIIVEGGRQAPNSAWWRHTAADVCPYYLCVAQPHARGAASTSVRAVPTDVAVTHAFVGLSRRSDDLYAALPTNVTSNLTNTAPVGWAWTYPLTLDDGTDRFSAAAFTDGLLGVPLRLNPVSGVDYAGVRRRVGPRLIDDARPPEYIRVNVDMGGAVVLKAFAWALVADGTFPTLTVHGSNEPAFYLDPVVTVSARNPAGAFSRNTHDLAHGDRLCAGWRPGRAPP